MELYLFDARPDSTQIVVKPMQTRLGIEAKLIEVAIDDVEGVQPFYLNKHPLSSGFLAPSLLSNDDNPNYNFVKTWGENVELDKLLYIKTYPFHKLIDDGIMPPIDFLSIDAQGLEVRIIQSLGQYMSELLGLFIETEYWEIYDNQCLISDQLELLRKNGFRIAEMFGPQYWYPGPAIGKGWLTLGESLWLKHYLFTDLHPGLLKGFERVRDITSTKLFKLALISSCFQRYSLFYMLLNHIKTIDINLFSEFMADSNFKEFTDMYTAIQRHLGEA
jgi:hypothetical protein